MSTVIPQVTDAVTQSESEAPRMRRIPEGTLSKCYGKVADSMQNAVHYLYQAGFGHQRNAYAVALTYIAHHFPAGDASTDASAAVAAPSAILGEPAATFPAETRPPAQTRPSDTALLAATASTEHPHPPHAHPHIVQIPRWVDDSELYRAGQFAYAIRASTDAVSATMDDTGRLMMRDCTNALKIRASAQCLAEMVRNPEKYEDYKKILDTILALE